VLDAGIARRPAAGTLSSMRPLAPAIAAILHFAAPAAVAGDCDPLPILSVAMHTDSEGGVYVPMTISGRSVNMLIDTMSIDSMLTRSTVHALGLNPVSLGNDYLVMFGGEKITHYATAHGIDFGGLKTASMNFLIMPDGRMPPDIGGTFAPDILRAYDDELDFAGGRLTLYAPMHCPGVPSTFAQAPAALDFVFDDDDHIALPVDLDGKSLLPRLDTGASQSLMSLEAAAEIFEFDGTSPLLKPGTDPDLGGRIYRYPFRALSFGGIRIDNPDIVLVPDGQSRFPGGHRFVLGMNILRQLRLYIAYGEKKLYIARRSH
jgi:predicted aspartyl protease